MFKNTAGEHDHAEKSTDTTTDHFCWKPSHNKIDEHICSRELRCIFRWPGMTVGNKSPGIRGDFNWFLIWTFVQSRRSHLKQVFPRTFNIRENQQRTFTSHTGGNEGLLPELYLLCVPNKPQLLKSDYFDQWGVREPERQTQTDAAEHGRLCEVCENTIPAGTTWRKQPDGLADPRASGTAALWVCCWLVPSVLLGGGVFWWQNTMENTIWRLLVESAGGRVAARSIGEVRGEWCVSWCSLQEQIETVTRVTFISV